MTLPATVRIRPGTATGRVRVPGSKSYTHRALVAASLSGRPCRIVGPLVSDDTAASRRAVRALGHRLRDVGTDRSPAWEVTPGPQARRPTIFAGESGTTLRLFAGAAATGVTPVRFTAGPRLSVRPMAGLLAALKEWGATVHPPPSGRSCPFRVMGPLLGGRAEVPGDMTSQFVSSLLMAAPRASSPCRLDVTGARVSEPYIQATLGVLAQQRLRVRSSSRGYLIAAPQSYRGGRITVPADASSAAYHFALAVLTGGEVTVDGLDREWPQADLLLLDILRRMGADVRWRGVSVHVRAPTEGGSLNGFTADVDDAPDLAPLLGVLAALAGGRSEILGGRHLTVKESDRRAGTARLAQAFGARVKVSPERTVIRPGRRPRRIALRGESDHRLVMSAAVGAAALSDASSVGDARAASKSYPGFFEDLGRLGIGITRGGGP